MIAEPEDQPENHPSVPSTQLQVEALTLEQKFKLKSFEAQVVGLNHAQTLELLLKIHTQLVIQEATYKRIIGQKWGFIDA